MRFVLRTALVIVLGHAGLTAQKGPNFSGRWIAVEPASAAGHELLITQDDATLKLEQARLYSGQVFNKFGKSLGHEKGDQESTTYRLDGRSTTTSRAGDDPQPVRSSIRWSKARLVLIDFYQAIGLRVERTLAFDTRGRLVLEKRRPVPLADQPPESNSAGILEPKRIVFEKRP